MLPLRDYSGPHYKAIILFIFSLFNNDFLVTQYIASNERMIRDKFEAT
jgi:hypothetical protein